MSFKSKIKRELGEIAGKIGDTIKEKKAERKEMEDFKKKVRTKIQKDTYRKIEKAKAKKKIKAEVKAYKPRENILDFDLGIPKGMYKKEL